MDNKVDPVRPGDKSKEVVDLRSLQLNKEVLVVNSKSKWKRLIKSNPQSHNGDNNQMIDFCIQPATS